MPPFRTSVTIVDRVEAETPANISIIGGLELAKIPGVNVDDRLRMVPGFSLFRRTSSLVANPTTQGVSLRGIGSTGASRTLVLWDGVPVNDPFGGWVYWTRFAPEEIDRVEVMRGASTSVFGDRAMSGSIALFSPSAEKRRAHLGFEGGNLGQYLISGGFTLPFRNFGFSTNVRAYETDGYFIVPANIRGRADTRAGVKFVAPDARIDYFGSRQRFHFKTDLLIEERANGTVEQANSTSMGTVSAHYSTGTVTNISLLGYHTREEYRASFSTTTADRNTDRLSYRQSVPSEATGGALLFRRAFSGTSILAGADAVRVEGFSIDSLVPTGKRIGGGTQLQHGVFGQVTVPIGALQLFGGARHQFTGQGSTFFSPTGGATYGRKWYRLRASAYRSFRAPTLNELFREFRAGNATTQPNDMLRQEAMTGVEAGFDLVGETRRLGVTAFRNSLSDLITNVTLVSTPAQIIRQRRNAAAALSRGFEVDLRQRWHGWHGELSYLFAESRYSTRERLPQIPKHQGSAQLSYARGKTTATAGLRSFSAQFEDDRNQFLLPGFMTMQFTVRQHLVRGLSATASFENLFDRSYVVGFSPTPNIGAPRLWRLGLRWSGL